MNWTPKNKAKVFLEELTDITTAATMIGVHKVQVHRWMRSGRLQYELVGHKRRKSTRLPYLSDIKKIIKERAIAAKLEGKA